MEFWDVCTAAPSDRARSLFLADSDRAEELRAKVETCGAHDPELWKKLPEILRGRPCHGGLDLSKTTDMASLCFVFPPQAAEDRTALLWRNYLPRETLKLTPPEIRKRYEAWAQDGALILTPGNVADYEFIERDVVEWTGLFSFGALGIDPYNATQAAVNLRDKHGVPVEFFRQGFLSMNPPSKEFERLFLGCDLEHGNNPVARWMAENVAVETDAHDNIKPVKPSSADAGGRGKSRKSSAKVDGIVAAIIGLGMTMANPVQRSIYEERGLRWV
jgi:phage terminase large subunit-like protein